MRCATLDDVAGDRLDQHVDGLPDAVLRALRDDLLDQVGEPRDPAVHDVAADLAVERRRLGAVLVRVAEDPDRVETRLAEEARQLRDVGLPLAGEADDHVAARAGGRSERAHAGKQVEEPLAAAEPPHPPQHRLARVLERQVEVRRDTRRAGDRLHQ